VLRSRFRDDGQVTIFVVIAMAMFLLGFVGFAVDMTNLWFHRQMAQGAADAACQAGIMNVLVPTPATQGFTPGTGFDCSATAPNATSGPTPCRYAALNGYNGSGLVTDAPSNSIAVTFPGSAPSGIDPSILPPTTLASNRFLRVDIVDRVKLTFATLIPPFRVTQDVRAQAICGLTLSKAPIPLIVLNPTCTHPLQVSGSAALRIVGGPIRSVQVNSANQTCAAATQNSGCSGSATIDLSQGGPAFTGSQFGVFGAPPTAPSGFLPGSTGSWSNASPIADPFSVTPDPVTLGVALPTNPPVLTVNYTDSPNYGCPDHSQACKRYQPGIYTSPIVVKGVTAIFDPGIYIISPDSSAMDSVNCGDPGTGCVAKPTGQCYSDFTVDANGVVRPSNVTGNGNGTMFYLSGSGSGAHPYGSAFFGANAGKYGGRTVDGYDTTLVTCPGGTAPDSRVALPALMQGNVLLGQCTSGGNYLPFDTDGPIRGLLFFGDRNNGTNGTYINGQPSMQGGGGLLLSGSLYFTNWPNWGTSPPSLPPVGYNAFLNLQGTPGSGTFVLGNITTDELIEGGNGEVAMQLDPNRVYNILKATLMR
jgi:hypothetical protein